MTKSTGSTRKASAKTVYKSSSKTTNKSLIRHKGWKRSINIDAEKYAVVSRAILSSLTTKPLQFQELVIRVKSKLKNFSGSVSWYTISILRELETQGKVIRKVGRPTTYQKV